MLKIYSKIYARHIEEFDKEMLLKSYDGKFKVTYKRIAGGSDVKIVPNYREVLFGIISVINSAIELRKRKVSLPGGRGMTGARINKEPREHCSKSWAAGFRRSPNGWLEMRIILPPASSHSLLTSFSA